MSSTYEMLWDCGFCGTKKNLGKTHRHCPGCGAAQDEKARYFPAEEDKVAVKDHNFVGGDKECPACGSPMSAIATHCGGCGSPLDGAKSVALIDSGDGKEGAKPLSKEERKKIREAEEKAKTKKDNKKGCLIGTTMIGSFLGLATYLGWTSPVGMEVTRQHWERTIAIEAFGPVERGAWCNEVPSKGRVSKRSSKVRSTKKIPDGEQCSTQRKDNGDGTFSESQKCTTRYREEDVKADYCDYFIDDWSVKRSLLAEGSGLGPRAWPASEKLIGGQKVGSEREGARKEILKVALRAQKPDDDGELVEGSCEVSAAHYEKMKVGTSWEVGVRTTGGLDCSEIHPPGSSK